MLHDVIGAGVGELRSSDSDLLRHAEVAAKRGRDWREQRLGSEPMQGCFLREWVMKVRSREFRAHASQGWGFEGDDVVDGTSGKASPELIGRTGLAELS